MMTITTVVGADGMTATAVFPTCRKKDVKSASAEILSTKIEF